MDTEASWRLKLRRADEHFADLDRRTEPYRQIQPYDVEETVADTHDGRVWTYTIQSRMPEPDPYLAVILGDCLFNIRSALDHLAVSLVPPKRQSSAFFPILTVDPEIAHPKDRKGDDARRAAWETATKGMSDAAVTIIRSAQPYNVQPPDIFKGLGLTPADHVLAILSAFQNADKHRRLITTISGLDPQAVTITERASGQALIREFDRPLTHLPKNGAIVFRESLEVDIAATGSTVLAAGIGKDARGPYRKMQDFLLELLRVVTGLADSLEKAMSVG